MDLQKQLNDLMRDSFNEQITMSEFEKRVKNYAETYHALQLQQAGVSGSFYIGEYEIKQYGKEEFKVIRKYVDNYSTEIIICGGDFETLINCLFIQTKKKQLMFLVLFIKQMLHVLV
jgi:hypothetical protein